MSTISPSAATAAANSSAAAAASNSSNSTGGFNNLTTADFMQMLIAELENQDPTNPMSNEDLLTQLSTMSQLQSTQDLDNALQSNTNNQQLSIASSFIGANITGTDSNNNAVNGIVSQALLQNGAAYVQVGSTLVPLANVTGVAPATS
jgi:flagellar basal-body rod modification protein FlgD